MYILTKQELCFFFYGNHHITRLGTLDTTRHDIIRRSLEKKLQVRTYVTSGGERGDDLRL